ncbi:NADP-dependent isocitrate dehydrogenase [Persicobacter sp. CCB-QB2]|uniref:NADP-dependent isocitrate dehydrogenase n=1 Tax=Persicobacter sp. CCB-QB2 TaxID=1561025 RepID=UPI0006A9C131|nr:NADP-dependent isocitrate dehydrogenase [Persicobacter sp. CCB-QB2]
MPNKTITVAHGDGIGPEIMEATLAILEAAKAPIDIETIEIGKNVYLKGVSAGIEPSSWESLRKNKIFLKAPITTPQGGGFKSLNVTTRKTLGLYANVRPCRSFFPYVQTHHPLTDMVIIRENEEDLYAGIEHQQTEDVVQCLKLISRSGCEKIVRYAYEYARKYGRKKVTCMTKDNIMKQADGLFHRVFDEVGKEYPEIEQEHMIIDIGSAMIADRPHIFDVIVTLNLYGDIISDIAAQITGSVGLGGSSNVGENYAMFEAIHGSAPDIAGKNIANPSGLINAAVMMMVHIGEPEIAEKIQNAWLKTIEDGIHTADIYDKTDSKELVGTKEFALAVIERLGKKPSELKSVTYDEQKEEPKPMTKYTPQKKELVGVDVFIDWKSEDMNPNTIGDALNAIEADGLKLRMISNRGIKVYPDGNPETFCVDHWRCRFVATDETVSHSQVAQLLTILADKGHDFIKTEHLYMFNGERAYSLGQGE